MTSPLLNQTPATRALQTAYRDVSPVRLVETVVHGVGTNDSPALRLRLSLMMAEGRWRPGQAWCAAWATTSIHDALADTLGHLPPLTASCSELAAWGLKNNLCFSVPESGDLFVIASGDPSHPYHHTGFVVQVDAAGRDGNLITGLHTLEGNTNSGNPPSREGYGVFDRFGDKNHPLVTAGLAGHERTFRFGVDLFIRWPLRLGGLASPA